MNSRTWKRTRTAFIGGLRVLLVAGVAATVATGCDTMDELLDVEAPSKIPAKSMDDPAKADLLVKGAIGDFECAYGAYVVMSGLLTDELTDATQTADRWVYDRRDVQPSDRRYATYGCTALGIYTPLSKARWAAENALHKLDGWTDAEVEDRQALIATAAAYSGYSHLLLGEGFETGVLLDDELQPGGEVSREEVLERAETRFRRAIQEASAAGLDDMLNMARVGLARTLLDLDRGDEAVTVAREVPEGFVLNASASDVAGRRQNRVYAENNRGQSVAVAPEFRDLSFGGVADPRVAVTFENDTATDGTLLYYQNKYESISSPIPIASWDEAQLIIAEVEGGQTAVDIINMFHDRAGLPDYDPAAHGPIADHVIQERSRELFLEGHRLNDIRRLDLPLSPAPGTEFDNGGVYGATRSFPLPDVERRNNPNIGG